MEIDFANYDEEAKFIEDNYETFGLTDNMMKPQTHRQLIINGKALSSIDNRICAHLYKSFKNSTKKFNIRIETR